MRLVVAGRTDAGVHATGQVAHCDVSARWWDQYASTALRRFSGLLARDVRVYRIAPVRSDFDARFGALWRRYLFRLTDADFGAQPLRRHDTVAWRRSLDSSLMHEAAQNLLGLNDFVAFCKRRDRATAVCDRRDTTVRQLQQLDVVRDGDLIEVRVQADAFCRSMVRSLVGALVAVGDGRRPVGWPAGLLSFDARCDDLIVAPSRGLTLVAVGYPPADQLATRADLTRRVRTR